MTNQQREETLQQLGFWATCSVPKVGMIPFLETFRQSPISGPESVEIGLLNALRDIGVACQKESMICGLCPVYQRFNGNEE